MRRYLILLSEVVWSPSSSSLRIPSPSLLRCCSHTNGPLETLHLSIDVSGNGRLGLPPYADNAPSQIRDIRIFLASYVTGLNFTVSNGTRLDATAEDGNGVLMAQEPGSTVKHVNWLWPTCLVGDGRPSNTALVADGGSARGLYNVSFHQSLRLNGSDYYTVFDLPVAVTNRIDGSDKRSPCNILFNPLLTAEEVQSSVDVLMPEQYPWTDGSGVQVVIPNSGTGNGGSATGTSSAAGQTQTPSSSEGIGGAKPEGNPADGLGSGAERIEGTRWAIMGTGLLVLFAWTL